MTCKGTLYKTNSGKDKKTEGLLGLHRNVRLPLSQKGGKKKKKYEYAKVCLNWHVLICAKPI